MRAKYEWNPRRRFTIRLSRDKREKMRQNLKNNGHRANRLMGRIAAERKKMVMAFCLIGLMVFLWVRVLGKKGPQGAEASFVDEQINTQQVVKQIKITFVELPYVKGRHDSLARDFFAVESWHDFASTQGSGGSSDGVNVVSNNGFEDLAKLIGEKLKLEVIEMGNVPQAFIGGKLMAAGDKIEVSDGIKKYECEVVKIEKNAVHLKCGNTEVQLKLIEISEETAGQ